MKTPIAKLALLSIVAASLAFTGCVSVKKEEPAVTTSRTTSVTPLGVSQTTTVAE